MESIIWPDQSGQDLTPVPTPDELVSSFSNILHNTIRNIWLSKTDAEDAIRSCYKGMIKLLDIELELTFRFVDNRLQINGQNIEMKSDAMRSMIAHWMNSDITNFTFKKGVPLNEFNELFEILAMRSEDIIHMGGFHALLTTYGLTSIITQKVTLQAVAEGEVVIARDRVGEPGTAGATAGPEKTEEPESDRTELRPESIGNILAFLRGDLQTPQDDIQQAVQTAASDGEKLAQLILAAADIQQQNANLERAETLDQIIVGCLRRTYDALRADPATKTQQGKKNLTRTLIMLEKEILERMRDAAGADLPAETTETITSTVEEMKDELRVDTITADYMRKRKAIEDSEKRILRFIQSQNRQDQPPGELQARLMEQGLSSEGWKELLVKSGITRSGGGGGEAGGVDKAIDRLVVLLKEMDRQFDEVNQAGKPDEPRQVIGVMIDVNTKIQTIVQDSLKTIEKLAANIQADEALMDTIEREFQKRGSGPRITRRQLIQVLVDVTRNLSEPVSLIRYVVESMDAKTFGKVNRIQSDVLRLAAENADSVTRVVAELEKLAT